MPGQPTPAHRHAARLCADFPAALLIDAGEFLELSIGGDRGCILRLTATSAELRLPTIDWDQGAHSPNPTSRFWKRLALRDTPASHCKLHLAIQSALAARNAEFQPCRFCRVEFPPEHRTGNACHGCASRHLGIAY